MKLNNTTFFLGCVVGGMGAAVVPLLLSPSRAEAKLLPFQGRLTDAGGASIPDGAKVVEFKMYDAPTGGTVKWAGEVHKLSVNGGLVNTMLGSKATLGGVDFSLPTYLQITIDANNDGQINAADPPLLPRQNVIPAVYAVESGNSRKLNNADWSAILTGGANDPVAGTLRGDKLATGSVNTTQLATASVTSSQLASNAVASAHIVNGTIQPDDLSSSLLRGIVPPGTVVAYFGTKAPDGWLMCDGAAYDITGTYSSLFAAIGTACGAPSPSQFRVPDLRGQFLRGADDPDGTAGDFAAANRDPNARQRTAMADGGNTGATVKTVGSVQSHQVGAHTHGEGLGSINGNMAAKIYVSDSGNTWIWESSISDWIPNSLGSEGGKISWGSGVSTQGAAVVGNTALNNPSTTETRSINAYANYIIKY